MSTLCNEGLDISIMLARCHTLCVMEWDAGTRNNDKKQQVLLAVITEQRVPPSSFHASGGHSSQHHRLFFARHSAARHTTWLCTRCLHRASPLAIFLPVVMPVLGCLALSRRPPIFTFQSPLSCVNSAHPLSHFNLALPLFSPRLFVLGLSYFAKHCAKCLLLLRGVTADLPGSCAQEDDIPMSLYPVTFSPAVSRHLSHSDLVRTF